MYRTTTEPERRILDALRKAVPELKLDEAWLDALRVESMDDNGLGSLRLSDRERVSPRIAAELQFNDSDSVPVLASLFVDEDGTPLELDIWKVDYSPLACVPVDLPPARRFVYDNEAGEGEDGTAPAGRPRRRYSIQWLDEVQKLLGKIEEVDAGPGASRELIAKAEHKLSVRFSESYAAFLERYGWLEVGTMGYISGLGVDVPAFVDVVAITLGERTEMEPAMPPWLVPVMNDGAGNNYCLDTRRMKEGECPVVFWDQEAIDGCDQIPAVVAGSFIEWLVLKIEEHIREAGEDQGPSPLEFEGPGYTAELVGIPYPRFAPEENVDVLVRLEDGTAYAGVLVTLRYFEYEFRASAASGEHGPGSYAFWVGMVIVRDFKRGTLQHALDALVETGDIDCCFIRQVEGEDDDTEGSDG